MSTFVKLIIGFLAFLIYGSLVFYGCDVVDDCIASKKSSVVERLKSNPDFAGISVDADSCGKIRLSGVVASQELKRAAVLSCRGCRSRIDASAVVVKGQPVAIVKPKAVPPPVELSKNDCQKKLNKLLAQNKIQFQTGRANISTSSDQLLSQLAETLQQCDKLRVVIEGHTDTRGSASNNQSLSERRANAVVVRLYQLGLTSGRASAVGMGEANPIANESTPDGLAKNRRIEFKLQGEQ